MAKPLCGRPLPATYSVWTQILDQDLVTYSSAGTHLQNGCDSTSCIWSLGDAQYDGYQSSAYVHLTDQVHSDTNLDFGGEADAFVHYQFEVVGPTSSEVDVSIKMYGHVWTTGASAAGFGSGWVYQVSNYGDAWIAPQSPRIEVCSVAPGIYGDCRGVSSEQYVNATFSIQPNKLYGVAAVATCYVDDTADCVAYVDPTIDLTPQALAQGYSIVRSAVAEPIPEPSSMALLLSGLVVVLTYLVLRAPLGVGPKGLLGLTGASSVR